MLPSRKASGKLLETVPPSGAIRWCVPKPNGKVRLCVDLTKLNSQVERVVYPSQSPRDVIQAIPRGPLYSPPLMPSKGFGK